VTELQKGEKDMKLTRRQALALSAGAVAFAVTGLEMGSALADAAAASKRIAEFAGGKTPQTGKVKLNTPQIAENGNTVPVSVSVDSEMTESSYVQSVMLVTDGNPSPAVVTFNFTPMSGEAKATTRMRLAKTQNVIAVAKMSDGSVYMDKKEVKVTIGGCGG
jgi:sulfur-oxidizing protein SoxY